MLIRTNLIARVLITGTGLLVIGLLSQVVYAHGMSEADKLAIIEGGNLRYMRLGATHMLSGFDHLAFVFGIIFFLTSFRDIAKYVTAFTLGHSVTLIFATFNQIQLNYFAIDAVIGLSVCYIAFANIDGFRKYLNINPPNMLLMIIGLGLIHGFGLSTRLQELPLSEDSLLLNIISFNIGIELGQIGALAMMLLLISSWRKRPAFKTFSLVMNYGLILAGGLLFLLQTHGYAHTSNPQEFIIATAQAQDRLDGTTVAFSASPQKPQQTQREDLINITIPARGDKEFKFHLAQGAALEYAWQTNGAVLFFDFHGEPAGDTTGYFKSFKKSTNSQSNGSLTASFTGTHGWYWKNNTASPIDIVLKAKGDYQRTDLNNVLQPGGPVQTPRSTTHDTIDSL